MKLRDIWNIIVQTLTAAWLSGFTAVAVLLPMVLLGLPQSVAVIVLLSLMGMVAGLTLYGAVSLHRERIRRSKGLCIRCGYNLEGSIDKCPECGKRFSRRVAA